MTPEGQTFAEKCGAIVGALLILAALALIVVALARITVGGC